MCCVSLAESSEFQGLKQDLNVKALEYQNLRSNIRLRMPRKNSTAMNNGNEELFIKIERTMSKHRDAKAEDFKISCSPLRKYQKILKLFE
jgi:hypothetical protein